MCTDAAAGGGCGRDDGQLGFSLIASGFSWNMRGGHQLSVRAKFYFFFLKISFTLILEGFREGT